jgi:hypothetical protein
MLDYIEARLAERSTGPFDVIQDLDTELWVVIDANGDYDTECSDRHAARLIAAMLNAAPEIVYAAKYCAGIAAWKKSDDIWNTAVSLIAPWYDKLKAQEGGNG